LKSEKETAFNASQYDLAYPVGIENHYWQKARARIIFNEIKKAKISELNFLEIGCGKGTVIRLLKEYGINIKGVELANIEPDSAVKEYITKRTNAFHLDSHFKESINCILLLDVIEHIENPLEFIQQIMNEYTNVEHILITVPARQELWSNYDSFYGHFKRYDLNDFKSFMGLGLTNIRRVYFYNTLYLAARLSLKFNKDRDIRVISPKGIMKWIHSFIALCFFIEYKIVPSKFYGSSIFSLLKKQTVFNTK
jgi:SAM-dependent methyltransferase